MKTIFSKRYWKPLLVNKEDKKMIYLKRVCHQVEEILILACAIFLVSGFIIVLANFLSGTG